MFETFKVFKISIFSVALLSSGGCGEKSSPDATSPTAHANTASSGLSSMKSCHHVRSDQTLDMCVSYPSHYDLDPNAFVAACDPALFDSDAVTVQLKNGPCPEADLAGYCDLGGAGNSLGRINYYFEYDAYEELACETFTNLGNDPNSLKTQ